jgi:hypothetical protein
VLRPRQDFPGLLLAKRPIAPPYFPESGHASS